MKKHKHHIIPRYRGGVDDPSNLVEVTVTQHAMFHYCEWRLWGDRRDYNAYRLLIGGEWDPKLRSSMGKEGGKKCKEMGAGIFGLTKEQRIEYSKKGGNNCAKRKSGIHGLSKEVRSEIGKSAGKMGGKIVHEIYPNLAKENGILGNKAQREKLEKEGKTIAEQKWEVITPEGETLIVENMSEFCLKNGLQKSKMTLVSQGERKHHKNYKCKKLTGNNKVFSGEIELTTWQITNPDGSIIEVEDLTEFCKKENINPQLLYRVSSGKRKHHKGYKVKKITKIVNNYLH